MEVYDANVTSPGIIYEKSTITVAVIFFNSRVTTYERLTLLKVRFVGYVRLLEGK